jgi:hypothetical protein
MRAVFAVGMVGFGLLQVAVHGQVAAKPAAPVVLADADKPRIYVTESDSWQVQGGLAGVEEVLGDTARAVRVRRRRRL